MVYRLPLTIYQHPKVAFFFVYLQPSGVCTDGHSTTRAMESEIELVSGFDQPAANLRGSHVDLEPDQKSVVKG